MSVAFDKVWIVLKQGLSPLQEDIQGADWIAGIGRQPDSPNPDPNTPPWGQSPNDMNEKKCKECGQPLDYMDYVSSRSGMCRRCQQYTKDTKQRDQGMEKCRTCRGTGKIDDWNKNQQWYPKGNQDFQKSGGILGQFNRGRGLYKNYPTDPWGPNPGPDPSPPYPGGTPYPGGPFPRGPRPRPVDRPCPDCRGTGWVRIDNNRDDKWPPSDMWSIPK